MLAIQSRSRAGNGNDTGPDAKQALARMKRSGYTVNPEDPEHIRAYIMLRQQVGRIDGDSMVKYLQTTTSQSKPEMGGKMELVYWGVPKHNFPAGPPEHWGECLMTQEQLAILEPIGGQQINWNDYYVVDQEIPRLGLGCAVLTFSFYGKCEAAHSS